MKYKAVYTKKAVNQLEKIELSIAQRIVKKVKFFIGQSDPLKYAKKLKHPAFGQYRFRVGDYRVIFDVDSRGKIKILYILTIKHRREIYQDI